MNDYDHRALLELQQAARRFLAQLTSMSPLEEAAMILRAMAESLEAGAVTKPPMGDVIFN
jgi:hypothetical protein